MKFNIMNNKFDSIITSEIMFWPTTICSIFPYIRNLESNNGNLM